MISEKRLVEFDSHSELMLKDISDSFLNFDRDILGFYRQKLDILKKSEVFELILAYILIFQIPFLNLSLLFFFSHLHYEEFHL